jgi:L-2,4-diaminobutyric acid acetyltransferase
VNLSVQVEQDKVEIGAPRASDGADIHRLVAACPPLDINSTYAYLLLCRHFSGTCVRAARAGRTVGFISAYRPPERGDTIFVWQVAVDADSRGQGLARRMLHDLLERPAVRGCRYLETTVSPSNGASMKLFYRLARELDAPVAEEKLFEEADFGDERHESEQLIRIGPFGPDDRKGVTRNGSQDVRPA